MYPRIKRLLDVVISCIALVVLSPLLLILAVIIKLTSSGPVLFQQQRVGLHHQLFSIYKFRTMYVSAPPNVPTHLLRNPEEVITPLGRFLRKSSLDELPQLLNIIRGEMSLVGPRPALWNQYDLIAERDKYGANDILPGLTGWAQVCGRDGITVEVKARLDGEYVQRCSLKMDIICCLRTVVNVIRAKDVIEGDQTYTEVNK